jgi:hypothetical protein
MLLHAEYAEVSDIGANALLPVKLRLKNHPLSLLDGLRRSFTGPLEA